MAFELDSSCSDMLFISESDVEEESGDMIRAKNCEVEAPSLISNKDPISPLVRAFFYTAKKPKDHTKHEENKGPITKDEDNSAEIKKRLELMENEIQKLRKENKKLLKAVKENEKVSDLSTNDKNAWEEQKMAEIRSFNLFKEEELMRLKKDRMLLEKQMKLISQLPTKKGRNEIEQLKKRIENMITDCLQNESRWRFMTKRLKRTIQDLNGRISELQEEVRRYERILQTQWDTIKSNRMPLKLIEDMKALYVHNRRAVTFLRKQGLNLAAETTISSEQSTHLDISGDNEIYENYDHIDKLEQGELFDRKTCLWATGIKRCNRKGKLCSKYKSTRLLYSREGSLENVDPKSIYGSAKHAIAAVDGGTEVNGDDEAERRLPPTSGRKSFSVL